MCGAVGRQIDDFNSSFKQQTMNSIWKDVEELNADDSISQVEKEMGIVFPHLFVETVKKYNGGRPLNNVFDTEKTKERVFSNFLTFNLSENNSIISIYRENAERFPSKVVPFATDPGGNYICFDYRKSSNPEVIFWNHEENFVVSDDDTMEYPEVDTEDKLHDIEFVAPDFFEFLYILYQKEEVEEDFSDFEVL
jgi:cell wall assembly regulator SMI1